MTSFFPRLALAACGVAGLAACATAPRPAASVAAPPIDVPSIDRPGGETPEWWYRAGAATAAAQRGDAPPRARNVIVFLGDGMGISTIAAARVLAGQREGRSGEETRLSFEDFPHTALSRTYEVDAQTADSSGTMSAIMTGVKTRFGVISVNQRTQRRNCATLDGNEAVTALELASVAGLATGVVSTARLTHATPAATYGHSPDRNWEADVSLPAAAVAEGCVDLARQFAGYDVGRGIDVTFAGGRAWFMPDTTPDPEYPTLRGKRRDGRDLVAEWSAVPGSTYVWNQAQFDALPVPRQGRVLGLFEPDHMRYEHDRVADGAGEPSLAELTRKAITLLRDDPEGYFLMVEGGRIDHGHHGSNAFRALWETVALSDAVRAAAEMTSIDDTLILVTADHSHTLTIAGYPVRGNPILGKVRGLSFEGAPSDKLAHDATGRTYTTLGYANGSGYLGASNLQPEGPKHFPHEPKRFAAQGPDRHPLDDVDTAHPDYQQESGVPLASETHGGEDVAVFARGPGAEAVRGSLEQNVLFHLVVQAQPELRRVLCELGTCDAHGRSVTPPAHALLPRKPD